MNYLTNYLYDCHINKFSVCFFGFPTWFESKPNRVTKPNCRLLLLVQLLNNYLLNGMNHLLLILCYEE